MSRMLALATEAYGGRGGIARATRDMMRALASQDWLQSAWILPRKAQDAAPNLPRKVRQAAPAPGRFTFAARAILLALTKRPQIVFCNHLFMAPLAALVARAIGAKFIVQLHGIEIWRPPSVTQRWAVECADLVLCVSRDTRARALTYCDVPHERAVVVNNTVDPCFTPGDRAAARAKFEVRDEFVLLSVSRLDARERYKGHDKVIAALPKLRGPEQRTVIYLVAGDGDDRARLEACTRSGGVEERVRFLGQIRDEDLPDLYRAADLFVLPSTGEGFGIVFLEAMACGTPALGLAVGGAPDPLGDGELGHLIDASTKFDSALQAAIEKCEVESRAHYSAVKARFGAMAFQSSLVGSLRSACG